MNKLLIYLFFFIGLANIFSQPFVHKNRNNSIIDKKNYRTEYGEESKTILIDDGDQNKKTYIIFSPNHTKSHFPVDSINITFIFDVTDVGFWLKNDSLYISNGYFSHVPVVQINPYTYTFKTPRTNLYMLSKFGQFPIRRILIKENLSMTTDSTFNFYETDANRRITFEPVNEFGQTIPITSSNQIQYMIMTPVNFSLGSYADQNSLYVSDFNNTKIISGNNSATKIDTVRIRSIQFPILYSINSDTILTNIPVNFIENDLEIKFPANTTNRRVWLYDADSYSGFIGGFGYSYIEEFTVSSSNWFGKILINNEHHPLNVFTIDIEDYMMFPINPGGIESLRYFPFRVFDGKVGFFYGDNPSNSSYLTQPGEPIKFGFAPIFSNGFFLNNADDDFKIETYTQFFDSYNRRQPYDAGQSIFTIYDSTNNLIYSDALSTFDTLTVPTGIYKTQLVNSNYYVGDFHGIAELNSNFNLSNEDANPPVLTSLRFLDNEGKVKTDTVNSENLTIQFSAVDISIGDTIINTYTYHPIEFNSILLDSSKLFVKNHNDSIWKSISLNVISQEYIPKSDLDIWEIRWSPNTRIYHFPAGVLYQAVMDTIPEAMDLKIRIMDNHLNKTEWILKPACFATDISTSIETNNTSIISKFKLNQNFPNPFNPTTNIEYYLPVTSEIEITLFNTLGQKVMEIFKGKQKKGLNKTIINGEGLGSGIYIYQLKSKKYSEAKKCILLK